MAVICLRNAALDEPRPHVSNELPLVRRPAPVEACNGQLEATNVAGPTVETRAVGQRDAL
eukprot:11165881-Lingulodinium_polyedra.AAC.1